MSIRLYIVLLLGQVLALAGAAVPASSRVHRELALTTEAVITLPPLIASQAIAVDPGGRRAVGIVRAMAPRQFRVETRETAGSCVTIGSIVSRGARQIRAHITELRLPSGTELFAYAPGGGEVHGPYDAEHFGDGFWTPPVDGEAIAIEAVHPGACNADEPVSWRIERISHIHDSVSITTNASSCELEVPAAWAEIAKSAALLQFVDGGSEYVCSGTLLSTVNRDLTPYVLTANHCIGNQEAAQSVRAVWRFESPGLGGRPYSDVAELLLTRSPETGTDYSLLLMRGALPHTLLSWSGWTTAALPLSFNVVGLHHPGPTLSDAYTRYANGRISGFTAAPAAYHIVDWFPGGGIVEHGSSGSGLWGNSPASPFLVGQLSTGVGDCASPNGYAYGSFSATADDITRRSNPSYLARGPEGRPDALYVDRGCLGESYCLAPGTYGDYVVTIYDDDWHFVSMPHGTTLRADLSFVNAYGNIDLEIYDNNGEFLAASTGSSNGESVEIRNDSSWWQYFRVRVLLSSGTRNTYSASFTVRDDCRYELSQGSDNGANAGGTGFLQVVGVPQGCHGSWSASSQASWLTLTGTTGGSGSGVWTVPYAYTMYPNSVPNLPYHRLGSIVFSGLFAGNEYVLWQQSFNPAQTAACSYELASTAPVHLPPIGSPSSPYLAEIRTVPANASCTGGGWSVTSNASWLPINSDAPTSWGHRVSGYGSGTWWISSSYAANPDTTSRTAVLTLHGPFVTGNQITVIQDPEPVPPCTYRAAGQRLGIYAEYPAWNDHVAYAALAGGSANIIVTGAPARCTGTWSAWTEDSWLTLSGATAGSGPGTWLLTYSYAPAASRRVGTVELSAPDTFTVIQGYNAASSLSSCSYSIAPTAASASPEGGAGIVQVTGSPSGCVGTWTAASDAPWLVLTDRTNGSGGATVSVAYTVAPNTGASRTAHLQFSWGADFPVAQSGPPSSIVPFAGNAQSVLTGSAFAPLKALVRDADNLPSAGVAVTFVVMPGANGAGGTFASTASVVTDAQGIATAPVLTANDVAGAFNVKATAASIAIPAIFSLSSSSDPSQSGPIAAPSSVTATASSATSVLIAWTPSPGATLYEVIRVAAGGAVAIAGVTAGSAITDTSAVANTAYLYAVRVIAPRVSLYSAADLASTIVFTNPGGVSGIVIRAAHLAELRIAVNAVRSLAGLASTQFDDPSLIAGATTVRAVHVIQLRSALAAARSRLLLGPATFVNAVITPAVSTIAAADIHDLRNGVR